VTHPSDHPHAIVAQIVADFLRWAVSGPEVVATSEPAILVRSGVRGVITEADVEWLKEQHRLRAATPPDRVP
jgi:hypothetical protein